MSGIVKVPNIINAITLGDGSHTPDANFNLTDTTDTDITTLVNPVNQPHIVSTDLTNSGALTISMPGNVTSIEIGTATFTPDGSQYNVITGVPAINGTLVVQQGFKIVDETT